MHSRQLLILIVMFCSLIFAMAAHAQLPQISSGLSYLTAAQNPDGTWETSTSPVETTVVTVSALETLKLLNQTAGTAYTSGAAWLQGQTPLSVDTIADQIRVLSLTGNSINALLPLIDPAKGAWGGDEGFLVNILDSSLALQALHAANYPDLTVINNALAYLTGSQNSDGSWSFSTGSDSNIYLTAIVSATLQQFPQMTSIAAAVNKATTYLLAHQNSDGGFGPSIGSGQSLSTVYETALAYTALAAVATNEAVLTNAANYLTSTQATNGSWNNDPYSTALALKALYLSENRPSPPPPPPAGGKFTGTVVDSITLQKVAGVTVALVSNNLINTVSDSGGNFTLADVPPGAQNVNFSLASFASTTSAATAIADVTTNLGNIPMTSAYTTGAISGKILDQTGKPLDNVAIAVSGSWSGSAVTGADGAFAFAFVTPGDVTITAAKTGYQSFSGAGRVYARTTLSISPRLNSAQSQLTTGSIIGRVISDFWGYPIDHLSEDQGVRVTISGGAFVEPDPNNGGKFAINGLAPNTYQVTIGMSGFVSQTFRLIVVPGVTSDLGTIRLVESVATMTLVGKVTDTATGLPIPSAEIVIPATGQTARSDFAGTYAIADIKTFQLDLKVSAVGYVAKTVDLYQVGIHGSIWTQTVDVSLTAQTTMGDISGRVIAGETGQPLAVATITLAAAADTTVTTGADGIFTMKTLQMGVQQLLIASDGYAPRTVEMVIFPGMVTTSGDIALAAVPVNGVIRGVVRNAETGATLAGVQVTVDGSTSLQTVTTTDGSYLFDPVAPGPVTVNMTKVGYYPARISATLAEGGMLVFSPALAAAMPVTVSTALQTDKPVYAKGDTVGFTTTLINRESRDLTATLRSRRTVQLPTRLQ